MSQDYYLILHPPKLLTTGHSKLYIYIEREREKTINICVKFDIFIFLIIFYII